MAIYHCSLRVFSRAEGHSAVAAAAYRAGAMLKDERTSRIHRYEKRHGVKTLLYSRRKQPLKISYPVPLGMRQMPAKTGKFPCGA